MNALINPQALEVILEEKCKDSSKFPKMPNNYYVQYCGFVNHLRTHIYPSVDAGLNANSKTSGYYTAHNAEHFDEVVRYAGDLLSAESCDVEKWGTLSPYELYVLLIAIRIHDVGNIHGREDHEKKCFPFLREHKSLLGNDISELKIIANIAEAHGGKVNGSRDTIGALNAIELVGKISIRPRLLAAIVRFADEICENSGRAATYLLENGKLPKHSEIYHKYANAIRGSVYGAAERRVNIKFKLTTEDVAQPWGSEERSKDPETSKCTVYLIDEILDRLEKMDRERRYCNIFSRETYAVESIRATIDIIDSETHDVLEQIPVPELTDKGYPDASNTNLKEQLSRYCGSAFASKYGGVAVGDRS